MTMTITMTRKQAWAIIGNRDRIEFLNGDVVGVGFAGRRFAVRMAELTAGDAHDTVLLRVLNAEDTNGCVLRGLANELGFNLLDTGYVAGSTTLASARHDFERTTGLKVSII